jgi:hypothetical protein
MSTPSSPVPFEPQSDAATIRDCGAACLSMLYASLRKPVPRAAIWPGISGKNRTGSVAGLTHLMVRDARDRGFAAVAIQAKHPLQALRAAHDSGVRVILNHRLGTDTDLGHYTLLVSMDEKEVVLHDPFRGPSQHVAHGDLLDLWQPRAPAGEVMGNLMIGITVQPSPAAACWLCQKPIPVAIPCPHCRQEVVLQPNSFLGCIDPACIVRLWNYVCCPSCDCGFTVSPKPKESAGGATVVSAPASAESASSGAAAPAISFGAAAINLDSVFAKLDEFTNRVFSVPGAVAHPSLQKPLEMLNAARQSLVLAKTEAIANEKAASDMWAKIAADSKKNEEAHQKKMDELNRPTAALDGNALAAALLKNLGFTR